VPNAKADLSSIIAMRYDLAMTLGFSRSDPCLGSPIPKTDTGVLCRKVDRAPGNLRLTARKRSPAATRSFGPHLNQRPDIHR
jgi:hypothetical protein